MKKRGHTRDCLDAAEAYLPCICGTDEHNRKVDAMTQPIPTNFGATPASPFEGPIAKVAFGFHDTSVAHGFWPADSTIPRFESRNFGEMVALMHSELSEALEEHRSGLPFVYENTQPGKEGKPEGIAVELVDAGIRLLETLASMADDNGLIDGYSIDELFTLKGEYNKGREAKHGRAY